MKYFFKILLTLVLAVATVCGVYYYFNGRLPIKENRTTRYATTVTKLPASELYAERTEIAKLKKQKIYLYKSGKTIIVKHGDKEFPFENWNSMLSAEEAPTIYYSDFDGDGVNEILLRCEAGEDENTKEKIYDLYVLNPRDKKESGYDALLISQETWQEILTQTVVEDLTQLKSNRKFLQFAMATKRTDIHYNEDSGLLTDAPSLAFARALQGKNGQFLTLNRWNMTKGIFTVNKDNTIGADVEVIVHYDETDVPQRVGKIHFGLEISPKNNFLIAKKSMYFAPDKAYRIADPRKQAQGNWEFKRNNSAAPKTAKSIQWLKYAFALDPATMEDTVDLGSEETDVKYIKSLVLHKNNLVITAADGCTFSADAVKSGDYAVTVNKGKQDEYEISYKASLNETATVLTVTFDKAYEKSEINTVDISYGSK